MSHYEERLEHDTEKIREKVADLALKVEKSVKNAVQALLTGNHSLSYETIIEDNVVNRANDEVNRLCYAFIALHLPSAGHLRRVSSILHVCNELERIGDQAVAISRVAVQLPRSLDDTMIRHIERMTEESTHMLHQSIIAFNEDNEELAKATMQLDYQADHAFEDAYHDLSDEKNKESWTIKDLLGLLSVFYSLERVSDLAKNICEKTVFSVTGEGKKRKPVSILFLDETNDYLSVLAEAIGRKFFPTTGAFSSAGMKPVAGRDPEFSRFMTEHGLDFSQDRQLSVEMLPRLDEYHVIISLQGSVDKYISAIPFSVIVLEWDIGPSLDAIPQEEKAEQIKQSYRLLSEKIHSLLETMRGKEASGATP